MNSRLSPSSSTTRTFDISLKYKSLREGGGRKNHGKDKLFVAMDGAGGEGRYGWRDSVVLRLKMHLRWRG